jgi:naphthalene 1,2-dioxygenase system ferredoxin subunit
MHVSEELSCAGERVARLDDIADGEIITVNLKGEEIALYRVGSEVYATDNICTHGSGRLCDGFLEGYLIECPLHQGAFDIRNGIPMREPADEPIATYVVEIRDGFIYLRPS